MRAPVIAALLFAAACVPTPEQHFPVTAETATQDPSGTELVKYLEQPNADAAVCDLKGAGPHISELAPSAQDAFVGAFTDGKIQPRTFRRCARTLLTQLPPDDRATLFDKLIGAYRKLLGSKLETNPAATERATILQRLYLDRAVGSGPHAPVLADAMTKIRVALGKKQYGPIATRLAQELIDNADLEQGNWHGAPVTASTMDDLAKAGNELTLRRFMQRLPTDALRDEAKRRILRIHMQLSPFAEVRDGGMALEDAILKNGANAISLADHAVGNAYVDESHLPRRTLVVRQDVWRQGATIMAEQDGKLGMVPDLPLHGALTVEVQGISRPVTVCANAAALDPSPCIAASELAIGQQLAKLDAAGTIHIGDERPIVQLLPLATQTQFALPISIAGKPATTLSWALRFARPDAVIFSGGGNGGNGPDVAVRIADGGPQRFEFDASANGRTLIAIVEANDLPKFRIGSAGGDGAAGSPGSDGASGTDGSECSDGSNGDDGGNGEDGGDGGDGGRVTVHIESISRSLASIQALVQPTVVSLGGNGGSGGAGGNGGAGGSGGSARSPTTHTDSDGNTVTDDPGCSSGMSGSSGSSGSAGSDGAAGRPGIVTFD
ncbi:MAG TPA: hypothetical protein VGM88_29040 [Kofleriaceae bacterium]|jgi:hypothetical protein